MLIRFLRYVIMSQCGLNWDLTTPAYTILDEIIKAEGDGGGGENRRGVVGGRGREGGAGGGGGGGDGPNTSTMLDISMYIPMITAYSFIPVRESIYYLAE